jgi:hypothetical protein
MNYFYLYLRDVRSAVGRLRHEAVFRSKQKKTRWGQLRKCYNYVNNILSGDTREKFKVLTERDRELWPTVSASQLWRELDRLHAEVTVLGDAVQERRIEVVLGFTEMVERELNATIEQFSAGGGLVSNESK